LESDEWGKWLKMYNFTSSLFSGITEGSSIFHVAAKWGIPCLVHFGLTNLTKVAEPGNPCASSKGFNNADFKAQNDMTPLEEAVQAGQIDVIAVFLEKAIPGTITHWGLPIAAASTENAKEMMELFLDRGGDQIRITEDMVKAAASNWRNGEEMLALMLDRRGDRIQITEDVVKGAESNGGCGKGVMALLMDRRGDQIQITSEAVIMICACFDSEIVKLLLDRHGDQIQITSDLRKF
jgi:hypothetical protein